MVCSGYNTDQALKVLPRILPSPSQNRMRLMVGIVNWQHMQDQCSPRQTIFFGANDARLPNTPGFSQTIPLENFRENIIKLATHELVTAHNAQVILLTPPPVDERLCLATDKAKGIDVMRRTAENTARYAEAVRQVGKQLKLPVVDVWSAFMKLAGMKQGEPLPGSSDIAQNEVLVRLMHDGECPTSQGQVFNILMTV